MARVKRLIRSIQTIAYAGLKAPFQPAWTREFLAHVYTYRPLPYRASIRCIRLPDLLGEKAQVSVTLRKCFPQHGNMTGEEIICLAVLIRCTAPRKLFEFGTFNGNTTLQMALNAGADAEVHTLNLPPDHGETQLVSSVQDKLVHPVNAGSGQAFRGEPEQTQIRELWGDSASFDFSPMHGQFDFVLVDAGHEYAYVKSDTENALRLLKQTGGVLVWHDFPNAPGVCEYLEELSSGQNIFHIRGTRLAFTLVGAVAEMLLGGQRRPTANGPLRS